MRERTLLLQNMLFIRNKKSRYDRSVGIHERMAKLGSENISASSSILPWNGDFDHYLPFPHPLRAAVRTALAPGTVVKQRARIRGKLEDMSLGNGSVLLIQWPHKYKSRR